MLLTLPLPRWPIPLGAALATLAVTAAVIAILARRGGPRELAAAGALTAALAFGLSLHFRGQVLRVESLSLYSFGVLLLLGVLVGTWVTRRLASQAGMPGEAVDRALVAGVAAGLVGARFLYFVSNRGDFPSALDALSLGMGGLSMPGGLLGGWLGLLVSARRERLHPVALADAVLPGAMVGLAIGHPGSYLAGAEHGVALGADAPSWLARLGTFPRLPDELVPGVAGPPVFIEQVLTLGLPADASHSLPVHPTPLYGALGAAALAAGLFALSSRRPFRGAVTLVGLGAFSALWLAIETVRGDPERGFLGPPISLRFTAGAAALLIFTLAVLLEVRHHRGGRGWPRILSAAMATGMATVYYLAVVRAGSGRTPAVVSLGQWLCLSTLTFAVSSALAAVTRFPRPRPGA